MIVVVGIGADGMSGLARESRRELRRAAVIYGSPRQLALLDDTVTAPQRCWPSPGSSGFCRMSTSRSTAR